MEKKNKPLVVTTTTTTTKTKQYVFDDQVLDVNQIKALLEHDEPSAESNAAPTRQQFKIPLPTITAKIKKKGRRPREWSEVDGKTEKENVFVAPDAAKADYHEPNQQQLYNNLEATMPKSLDGRKSVAMNKLSMSRLSHVNVEPWSTTTDRDDRTNGDHLTSASNRDKVPDNRKSEDVQAFDNGEFNRYWKIY